MQRLIRKYLWMVLLATGVQASWAFSLIGPVAFGGDSWQVNLIGYNPLPTGAAPPFLADPLLIGPKNIGEGYRRNGGYLVYACDANFLNFFGSNGVVAVDQAYAILNSISNVDNYSTALSEFPLNSRQYNYTAESLGLLDLKTTAVEMTLEQLGLADAIRYTWALHDRYTPNGSVCNPPGPGYGLEYTVIMRNFDITASPLTTTASQAPPYGQYSPYVNSVMYNYYIFENCGANGASPPDVDAIEIPTDPLGNNPPVASLLDSVAIGYFVNGLTRDDVAGLRYLISSNSLQTEVPALGSLLENTNLSTVQLLYSSNLTALALNSLTNPPAGLQAQFPGLGIGSVSNYYALVITTNVTIYLTNLIGSPYGTLSTVVAFNTATNPQQFFSYTYDNVVILTNHASTPAYLQTITVAPLNGSPAGSPPVTQISQLKSIVLSNVPSGEYYINPAGGCGYDFVQTLQTNVTTVTNNILFAVNGNLSYSQNLIYKFTNHIYVVAPCTLTAPTARLYQGIQRVQFVRGNFDSLLGQNFVPVTNIYTMRVVTNNQAVSQTFQRVSTAPDILYSATDQATGPSDIPGVSRLGRSISFDETEVGPGLSGPGVINSPAVITLDKVGTVFLNQSPSFLNGPINGNQFFVWGSFDGTTNDPVVYPNGTSLANLRNEILIQIYPATLPPATNGSPYYVPLSVSGGQAPYTWSLQSGPNGYSLLPAGVITNDITVFNPSGVYYFNIQMTDGGNRTVNMAYPLTIN